VKGMGFSPYVNAFEMNPALAAEGNACGRPEKPPQRLKPFNLDMSYGGAEAPPLQDRRQGETG